MCEYSALLEIKTQRASVEVFNPATGERVATYPLASPEEALAPAKKAREAYESSWSRRAIGESSDHLKKLAKASGRKRESTRSSRLPRWANLSHNPRRR